MSDEFIIIFYGAFYRFFFVIELPLFNLIEEELLRYDNLVLNRRIIMT
jgi:hypothetical protein